jgi:Ca2+-binding RTX toxin-like protein
LEEFMLQFRKRAALVAAAASLGVAALPVAARATATPVFANGTLMVSGDGASDTITLSAVGGQLALNGTAVAGANADGSVDVVVDGGDGRDVVDGSALAVAQYKSLTVHGGAGDDVITGGAGNDHLLGDDGNDRVIGFRGADDLEGGNGNDVLVWNNGDGSDVADGDAGADTVEVNGSQTGNDQFTVKPNGQRVQFDRISLNGAPAGNFGIDLTAEKVQVNGLGGDDEAIGSAGLAPLTSLELNGGTGADHLVGGDGADVINGGDDNDSLDGAGGNDRVSGDRGNDVMHGGDGDDVLVWNNGDGSDDNEGDAGIDTSEVNGAGQGDALTITPNGARARLDRTNLVPFGIDIATEAVQVNALGGDDTLSVAPGTGALLAVNANGGSGNDRLVGAEEADSFFGGAGDDVLDGGLGADLLDGQDGNDTLQARDGAGDLVRGGAGYRRGAHRRAGCRHRRRRRVAGRDCRRGRQGPGPQDRQGHARAAPRLARGPHRGLLPDRSGVGMQGHAVADDGQPAQAPRRQGRGAARHQEGDPQQRGQGHRLDQAGQGRRETRPRAQARHQGHGRDHLHSGQGHRHSDTQPQAAQGQGLTLPMSDRPRENDPRGGAVGERA